MTSASVAIGRPNLDFLVEQLYARALAGGGVRVVVDPTPDAEWTDAEAYWLVPDAARARLLLPLGSARLTAATARHYVGLRRPTTAVRKRAAAVGTRAGLPPSRHRLTVQVHRSRREVAQDLPVAFLRRCLGTGPLHASIGVRTGDNRKPTLALVDDDGGPVGYAKFGWDTVSDEYVRNEARVLADIAALDGPTRAPAVLWRGDYLGHPVLVTAPLPLDVRGSRRRLPPPTSEELYALAPVCRRAPAMQTEHARGLVSKIDVHARQPLTRAVAEGARDLLVRVAELDGDLVPVTARWHGDLTPWNRARDGDGRLWLWDWENSEPDTVAGLDALHWAFSLRRIRSRRLSDVRVQGCLDDALHHLVAAGARQRDAPVVASLYVATVVQRASELALHHGSWGSVWIGEDVLQGLVRQARDLLPAAP